MWSVWDNTPGMSELQTSSNLAHTHTHTHTHTQSVYAHLFTCKHKYMLSHMHTVTHIKEMSKHDTKRCLLQYISNHKSIHSMCLHYLFAETSWFKNFQVWLFLKCDSHFFNIFPGFCIEQVQPSSCARDVVLSLALYEYGFLFLKFWYRACMLVWHSLCFFYV